MPARLLRSYGRLMVLFFVYVATANPRTGFLVYSRGKFADPAVAAQ